MGQSHFSVTIETAVIRALLRDGLPSSTVSSIALHKDVRHVAVERLHYSTKRPIQLQLTLHGLSGWKQSLIAEWLGPKADEHAQLERQSLRKSRRAQLSRDDTDSIISLPEWGLVLRRPGLDSKLPGLRLLHHPEEAAVLLKTFAKTEEDKVKVELVAHRLGKRAVLRITTIENAVYYIRLRGISSQSGSVSYSRHQALYNQAKARTAIAIPKPLGYCPELGAAVFGELEGTPAEYWGAAAPAQCQMISQALRGLQSIQCSSMPQHTAEDEYAILLQLYDRTQRYFPEVALTIKEPMKWVGIRLRQSSNTPGVLAHRDLHQKQLLISETSVGILDFDTVCLAHPALDVGNLQAHVYFESQREGFESAPLEAALSAEIQNSSASEIAVWRCSALLRLAMIYAFSHEAKTTINSLTQEASSCRFV